MHQVLVLLPHTNDRIELAKLDKSQYEIHFLHASESVAEESLSIFDYERFLAQPGFLVLYVDRAVDYVKKHGITAIMYSHDMSSVVASVVCEKTGLRGPTLESTFCCLHKYYTRITDNTDMWFDYIHVDQAAEIWRNKFHYPCCLKAPFLAESKGLTGIKTEEEIVNVLINLRKLVTPDFMGYSNFFQKYLDLEKFPLAVENIVVVEEWIEDGDQYAIEGWADEHGTFTLYSTYDYCISKTQREAILSYIVPQFTLDKYTAVKLVSIAEETAQHFGLCNTFINIECWKIGGKFKLIEINSRVLSVMSAGYTKSNGVGAIEAGIHLACGELTKLRKHTASIKHKDGEPIMGRFCVPSKSEGKARDLIDYEYAKNWCVMDGVYDNAGPGLTLVFEENNGDLTVFRISAIFCYLTPAIIGC